MRSSTGKIAVDANIVLRFLLDDHPHYSEKAKKIMQAVQKGRISIFCDPVILGEVVWVLKSTYKVPPAAISAMLLPLISHNGVDMPNKAQYQNAVELYGSEIPHFGDACACAAALENCEGRLLSFDKDISEIEGLQRIEDL